MAAAYPPWQDTFRPETVLMWGPWMAQIGDLTRQGWDMRIEEYDYGRDRRMFLRNEQLGAFGVTEGISIDRQHSSLHMGSRPLRIAMNLAKDIRFQVMGAVDSSDAFSNTFDVRLGYMDQTLECGIQEVFLKNQPEEIIVEPQTVAQMLEQIRAMQSDSAKAILRKQRLRAGQMAPDEIAEAQLSAKILTFKR